MHSIRDQNQKQVDQNQKQVLSSVGFVEKLDERRFPFNEYLEQARRDAVQRNDALTAPMQKVRTQDANLSAWWPQVEDGRGRRGGQPPAGSKEVPGTPASGGACRYAVCFVYTCRRLIDLSL